MQCSTKIEDLEDLAFTLFQFQDNRPPKEHKLKKKIKIKKKKEIDQDLIQAEHIQINPQMLHNVVPGTQKIYVKTFGCSHNISDSEFMMGQLADYGYTIVDTPDQAHLVLINSCTVKNPSQDAFVNLVKKAKKVKKPLVVAGCVPQGQQQMAQLQSTSIVGISQIDRVVQVVQQTLKGNSVQLLTKKQLPSLDLPKIRRNKLIEIIPINSGCLGACTYCKTVHARGKLGSYEVDVIKQRVVRSFKQGVKQIWLTSEDTGAYGIDLNISISHLMKQLSGLLNGGNVLRLGMTNPPYILSHLQNVAEFLNHPNVFSFIHIPVQSGNDTVLDRMNRQYNVNDFQTVVDYLKKRVYNLTIATDIICGFPGQTDQQFQDTLRLIDKYKIPVVNISQFYSRPGTAAAKMQKVTSKIVKQRSGKLTQLFNSYEKHKYLIGSIQKVWINDSQQQKGQLKLVGHTKNYTKVSLPFDKQLLGQYTLTRKCVQIKVKQAFDWHIQGQILQILSFKQTQFQQIIINKLQTKNQNPPNKHLQKQDKQRSYIAKQANEQVQVISQKYYLYGGLCLILIGIANYFI